MFDYLANPGRFMRLSGIMIWPLRGIALAGLVIGSWLGLAGSPADYQQGEAVRLMYVHVPAAWLALSSYLMLGLASLFFIVWRHPLADIAARAIAPAGTGFAFLTLVTGALWGAPIWGTWWVWDGRLTSMLVLFFFFIGYLALANGFDRPERGARPAAILAMVGVLNLPIVKFSVDWWNTLHQPASILRSGGMAIDASMLWPLFTMFAGLQAFFLLMVIQRMRLLLGQARLARLAGQHGAS